MNIPVKVTQEAEADLKSARVWYESQQPGLGTDFRDKIEELLVRIEDSPRQFAAEYDDVRMAVPEKYPYVVYFRIMKRFIQVFAIHHGRRDPAAWKSRL